MATALQMAHKPEWVSIKEYADIYGVHRHTVAKWLDHELLITYRVGQVIRIRNVPPSTQTRIPPKTRQDPQ